ncbi:MAG: flagellar hook capping protein [Desulfobacteraceae bacterium]|nr:flagellar hook capping protein [Desulfobacteraceae bacterium]MCK5541244.1 flagellar hook capping protein [Desulfobacterales bacterium]
MTISASNNYVNTMSTSYESYDSKTKGKDDALGRDAFLTMMVAQLQNQDPLNPMQGSEFSSQLAQFSQLEQLMNLNETMISMQAAFEDNSDRDVTSYIGKEIIGDVDSMSVKNGSASEGYYSLPKPGEVRVEVYDSGGRVVKALYLGQRDMGPHSIQWDGTDSNGVLVPDGTYTYAVGADMGYGYEEVATTVAGVVEGIVYSGDKPFLVVDGVWVNPDSLLQVKANSQENYDSIIDYLGKNVTSSSPLVHVDDGGVIGGQLSFELENSDNVIIEIYNSSQELIRTIGIPVEGTSAGINYAAWDSLNNDAQTVADGVYSYRVITPTGNANISVTENVSGIKTVGGFQFLVLDNSGRLSLASSITDVN